MDKTYRVKITSQAEEQIQEIIHYIANDLNSPDSAFHLLDILEASFMSLERFPHRIAPIDDEPWHTKGIRRLPVKNFFIYFWINDDNKYNSSNNCRNIWKT